MDNSNQSPLTMKRTSSESHTPTVEQVLSAIDFEVNRIESEQKRPGWTLWAIYGSILSATWLLFDQWEKGNVDVINVIQLFLVFSILRDVVHYAKRQLLPPPKYAYNLTPRFRFYGEMGSPIEMFLYWIRFVLLFIISLFLASKVYWLQSAILLVFYGSFTLLGAFGFGATYFEFLLLTRHVPKARIEQNRKITIQWIVMLTALAWAMFGHLSYAISYYPDLVSTSDFRVAGLLVIISFLVPKLLEDSKNVPALVSLTEIRRDLAFGRIDANAAALHADIAIAGIPVEDKLQDEINNVLSLLGHVQAEYHQIIGEFDNLLSALPDNDSDITKEQEEEAAKIIHRRVDDMRALANKHDELSKLTRGLRLHSISAEEVAPESVKAAKDVLEKVDLASSDLLAKALHFKDSMLPMIARLSKARKRLAEKDG